MLLLNLIAQKGAKIYVYKNEYIDDITIIKFIILL